MLSLHLAGLGTFVPRMASTLVQPWSCTAASNLSTLTLKAKLSPIWVEFRHSYFSIPAPSTEDQTAHDLQVVAGALAGAAPPTSISQVDAIANIQDIFKSWCLCAPPAFPPMHTLLPGCPSLLPHEAPRVISLLPPTPGLPRLPVSLKPSAQASSLYTFITRPCPALLPSHSPTAQL
jgi:hypothetical protein